MTMAEFGLEKRRKEMPLLKLYSRKVLFDFTPKYENRLTVFAFQPSGALSIRVGPIAVTLTREEGERLACALEQWEVSDA